MLVNDRHFDNDGIPDYADGYDLGGYNGGDDDAIALLDGETLPFVPVVIKSDPNLSMERMTVQIEYPACDPFAVDQLGTKDADGQWTFDYPLPGHETSLCACGRRTRAAQSGSSSPFSAASTSPGAPT